MTRRIMDLLTALSLLLCVAAVMLWVRSNTVVDVARLTTGAGSVVASTAGPVAGCVVIEYSNEPGDGPPGFSHHASNVRDLPHVSLYSTRVTRRTDLPGGFSWRVADAPATLFLPARHSLTVALPLWCVLLAASMPPALRLGLSRLRRRRRLRGRCTQCGYDLRATPGRCPECGIGPAQESHHD